MLSRLKTRALHFAEVGSTMDVARKAAESLVEPELVVVTADAQTAGRGSNGRSWNSGSGNVSLTVVVPKDSIHVTVLPVFPLIVGLAVVDTAKRFVTTAEPKAKWPNDVIVDRRKVSGCLIEDCGAHLLVGIGINVLHAPETADGGRATACLAEFTDRELVASEVAAYCSARIVTCHDHYAATSRADVVAAYRDVMDWTCTMYRRLPDGRRGAKVTPVELQEFGQLVVRNQEDGTTDVLISDYLI